MLALPIGWNRERELHTAGIRTFPIVALGSCGLVLVAQAVPGASSSDVSRVLQGLVTGIGFVGGGAILKDKVTVGGTATAASIWSVGIASAAVGLGAYHVAIALSAVAFLTLKLLAPVKRNLDVDDSEKGRE